MSSVNDVFTFLVFKSMLPVVTKGFVYTSVYIFFEYRIRLFEYLFRREGILCPSSGIPSLEIFTINM